MTIRTPSFIAAVLALAVSSGAAVAAEPKYYFSITSVNAQDKTVIDPARNLLQSELASRPEFTSDLGGAAGDAALAELRRRGLRGFDVTMKIERLKKDLKPPKPGKAMKVLAIDVKLTVFGTTVGSEKLAFSGDGEAGIEAEVVERRLEQETAPLVSEVLTQAIKQAVDQAVAKLSKPISAPMNESRKRKAPKEKAKSPNAESPKATSATKM